MLDLLRRWLKKTRTGLSLVRTSSNTSPSQFISARFKDSHRELGYRLYLPSGASRSDSLPLIVMLHGCHQDATGFAAGTRMNALAETRGCAVLYPEQSQSANPLRCWNWYESASLTGLGEAALVARLIEQVTMRHPINPQRVYVVGMSAGGAMAGVLAARHSRLIAACAMHSGVMYGAAKSVLQALAAMKSGPTASAVDTAQQLLRNSGRSALVVPTLVIQGGRDDTVNPVNAERTIEQLRAQAEYLDAGAGAWLAPEEQSIESEGHRYRQQDYRRQGRLLLQKILIDELGHAWSGGDDRQQYNDSAGPDASRLILDFVLQHERAVEAPIAAPKSFYEPRI
jgi:poly(hydroxyalkanoate) depolymerase family esterase